MTAKPKQSLGILSALVAAALLGAGPAAGDAGETAARGAAVPEEVAISGIITDARETTFRLNYGGGAITVDMAGWRRYAERERGEQALFDVGENVTVTGVVDDALYRAKRLEALTVFVRDRDSFYAAASPESDRPWSLRPMPDSPLIGSDPTSITLAGRVSAIAGDELSLDLGGSVVSVDTAPMSYDPLDDIGNQRVREGDWVQVSGKLDADFFTDRRLGALRITSVYRMALDAL